MPHICLHIAKDASRSSQNTMQTIREATLEEATHLSISASTTRGMTSHFGLSIFLIWTATFPPIRPMVFIYQLVRYVRICTSKLDFIRRFRRLSSRLLHQGFKSMLLRKSFTKFFKRHSAIIEKYGTTLREIRLAIQN